MVHENSKAYQEEDFPLILHQVLMINLQGIVQQHQERISSQILGVKGF